MEDIIWNFINRLGVRNNCIFGGLLKLIRKVLFISNLVVIAPFPCVVTSNKYLNKWRSNKNVYLKSPWKLLNVWTCEKY